MILIPECALPAGGEFGGFGHQAAHSTGHWNNIQSLAQWALRAPVRPFMRGEIAKHECPLFLIYIPNE
jgi:hypothetical protein